MWKIEAMQVEYLRSPCSSSANLEALPTLFMITFFHMFIQKSFLLLIPTNAEI